MARTASVVVVVLSLLVGGGMPLKKHVRLAMASSGAFVVVYSSLMDNDLGCQPIAHLFEPW